MVPWRTLACQAGREAEADDLYLRAIGIGENALGPNHPDLAVMLNNRAFLLFMEVRTTTQFC